MMLYSDEHMRVLLDNENHIYFSLIDDIDEFWMSPSAVMAIADKLRQVLSPMVLRGDGFNVIEENV